MVNLSMAYLFESSLLVSFLSLRVASSFRASLSLWMIASFSLAYLQSSVIECSYLCSAIISSSTTKV